MCPASPEELSSNGLLRGLPDGDRDALAQVLECRDSAVRELVYEAGGPTEHVVFPIDSVFSLVATTNGERPVEVATVGNEGFLGLPAFLQGSFTNAHMAFCQVPGRALFGSVGSFLDLANGSSALRAMLHRYTLALLSQIAQSSACNRLHPIDQRAIRWILMTHDRVGRDEFLLTQEFLGQMLGVRRASVSQAHRALQREGLIEYRRGVMTVQRRRGLEDRACPCYAIIREEHERLMQPPW